jgi:hypothetical protein
MQGVAKARPTGVESGARRGITGRDVVEHEDIRNTHNPALVLLFHGRVDQAHANFDPRDQSAKIGCDQLSAVGSGVATSRGAPAEFSMDILRPLQ